VEFVFTNSDTLKKQELVKLEFGQKLYYKDGMYGTPTMVEMLPHNYLIMNEKTFWKGIKKGGIFQFPR